jgi:cystathionine gamma-synthase
MPPIVLSTTFERECDGSYPNGFVYTRTGNPNRDMLEAAIAALEGGATAMAFASGLAASAALLQTLSPGDEVVFGDDLYFGLRHLAHSLTRQMGLKVRHVNVQDSAAVRSALTGKTRFLWIETPSNPLLRIADIAQLADMIHSAGGRLVVDNTWATPVLQQPLSLGADVVLHSTTKYIGGHSDVLGGCVVLGEPEDSPQSQSLRDVQHHGGAVPSPFDCWLLLRSLTTLPLRVRAQTASASRIADVMLKHPHLQAVHYPGLDSHALVDVARRQMRAPGAMLSLQIGESADDALRYAARLKLIRRATSLGGVESLIEHRASVEGPDTVTPKNLLRLSVGLEDIDDLLEDLLQAF